MEKHFQNEEVPHWSQLWWIRWEKIPQRLYLSIYLRLIQFFFELIYHLLRVKTKKFKVKMSWNERPYCHDLPPMLIWRWLTRFSFLFCLKFGFFFVNLLIIIICELKFYFITNLQKQKKTNNRCILFCVVYNT